MVPLLGLLNLIEGLKLTPVITSYSIHYTKLYERIPLYNANGVNFNPSIKFNNPNSGTNYDSSAKLIGNKSITFQSGYAVYKWPETGTAGALVASSTKTRDYGAQVLGGDGVLFAVGTGISGVWRSFNSPVRERFQIVNYEINTAANHRARVDGKQSRNNFV